jgi:dTDP-4-dehydrorhamnose 3,5-epimerase
MLVVKGTELEESRSKDTQTVDAEGERIQPLIAGVIVAAPPVHEDHRGVLVEMYREPGFWDEPFAYAYQTSLRPGVAKGWFLHREKQDRYHLAVGELLLFLYDDRDESPTRGLVNKLFLSERNNRDVFIPAGVWHLSLNVGLTDAVLINLPTTRYNPESPDRYHLPFDTDEIPVDIRSHLPLANMGPIRPEAR